MKPGWPFCFLYILHSVLPPALCRQWVPMKPDLSHSLVSNGFTGFLLFIVFVVWYGKCKKCFKLYYFFYTYKNFLFYYHLVPLCCIAVYCQITHVILHPHLWITIMAGLGVFIRPSAAMITDWVIEGVPSLWCCDQSSYLWWWVLAV